MENIIDHAITEIQCFKSSDDEIEEQETKRKRDLTSGTVAFGLIYYALPLKFSICKNRFIAKKNLTLHLLFSKVTRK